MLLLAFATLAACAAPRVSGNAQGGVVTAASGGSADQQLAANTHCGKYGKTARLNRTIESGSLMFDCVW
ncbi:MAG TPA: hypothetical protein VJ890_05085 [Vineibacter sp.]|nr:hypothetical protein [Vineibacter sp.]